MKYLKELLLVILIILSSCYEDEQHVDYDYKNGDIATFVPNLSSPKDSVEFYIDEVKVATEYEVPFVCRYRIQNISSGKHTLYIKGFYSYYDDNGFARIELYTFNSTFTVK